MKARKRLYPTVREEREREFLKNKLGIARMAISKGGGMAKPKSLVKVRPKQRLIRD